MPGDPRIERTLNNLAEIIEHPDGWSPSNSLAWVQVAADAKRVIESLDELGPDSAIEQGISRLAMTEFLRGASGSWGEGDGLNVRYRGHRVQRNETPDGRMIVLYHDNSAGRADATLFEGRRWLDTLRNLDTFLDAVLAVHPMRPDVTFAMQVEANTIDRVLGVAKQVSDATAHDPVANTAVWDVIDRIQKLRPVDVPTEQDRAEAEADDEREAKARSRAEEWPIADDGSDLTAREREAEAWTTEGLDEETDRG